MWYQRLMERLTFEMPQLEPGWVWLTGAGPGDPGLLTLHALNGIRQADVIVMLHQGGVVEVGTHEKLMSQRGRYYALYRQQESS